MNRGQHVRLTILLTAAIAVIGVGAVGLASDGDEGVRGFTAPREAKYWEALSGNRVRCGLCPRRCVVPPGGRGHCGVRENRGGTYYTLSYGNPCAVHVDPIEKKPFYHYLPGTTA
ncbi:MAG: hypothetical protein JXB46_01000, partial [Candidatus Eisenbacteria bacterium]|nr:hypothetical protein [Candidatus Eisenbacteria bacterium]